MLYERPVIIVQALITGKRSARFRLSRGWRGTAANARESRAMRRGISWARTSCYGGRARSWNVRVRWFGEYLGFIPRPVQEPSMYYTLFVQGINCFNQIVSKELSLSLSNGIHVTWWWPLTHRYHHVRDWFCHPRRSKMRSIYPLYDLRRTQESEILDRLEDHKDDMHRTVPRSLVYRVVIYQLPIW